MIIAKESPLRRIPHGWDRKETLFYDAIRCSIEMTDMGYFNLHNRLLELTSKHDQDKGAKIENIGQIILAAMLNAWSVIDSTYRLRGLLEQIPRIKHNSPPLILFRQKTQNVETPRHIIQHLNTEINNIVIKNLTVLGVLSWVAWLKQEEKWCYTCSIAAGSLFERTDPFINPAGKSIRPPIDLITLDAGYPLNLSSMMVEISKVTHWLEEELKKHFGTLPQAGADVFYSAEYHWS
ncbi:hypothetical protein ACFLX4_00205 [Chloroflexota bacterium]